MKKFGVWEVVGGVLIPRALYRWCSCDKAADAKVIAGYLKQQHPSSWFLISGITKKSVMCWRQDIEVVKK